MTNNDDLLASSELASMRYLLKRFEKDMLSFYKQMDILRIIFKNLEGSWLAISLAHKAFKSENNEKH